MRAEVGGNHPQVLSSGRREQMNFRPALGRGICTQKCGLPRDIWVWERYPACTCRRVQGQGEERPGQGSRLGWPLTCPLLQQVSG